MLEANWKMNLKNEIAKYETMLCELLGKTIKKVNYFEIDYGEPTFEMQDHHSLDYGLQLETNDAETYYMIWDSQYFQYDLKFKKGTITEEFNPESKIKSHDVSQSEYWTDRIGEKIRVVKSYWSYVTTSGKHNKTYYPQDIEIIFENELGLIVSAIEIRPDEQISGVTDHVSVFFDSETAKKYGAKNEL